TVPTLTSTSRSTSRRPATSHTSTPPSKLTCRTTRCRTRSSPICRTRSTSCRDEGGHHAVLLLQQGSCPIRRTPQCRPGGGSLGPGRGAPHRVLRRRSRGGRVRARLRGRLGGDHDRRT